MKMSLLNSFVSLAAKAADKVCGSEIDEETKTALNTQLITSIRDGLGLTSLAAIVFGADVHAQDEQPLAAAAFTGNLTMVRLLFERGARITDRHLELANLGETLCNSAGDRKGAASNAHVEAFLRAHRPQS
jgi:hypothetical protein